MGNLLDVRTLMCPEPMMLVRSKVRKSEDGTELEVHTDDPRTPSDLVKFCEFQDHTLISQESASDVHGDFTITKIKKGK